MFAVVVTAIVLAVVMLAVVNWIVWKRRRPTLAAVVVCFVFSGAPILCVYFMVPLLAQGLALAVALPLAYIPRRGPGVYHIVSVVAALAIWIAIGVVAFHQDRQYDEWRDQTAVESMHDRVVAPTPSDGEQFTGGPMWSRMESNLEENSERREQRARSLRVLHEHRVILFHQSMGFGIARMGFLKPKPEHFEPEFIPVIPQGDEYKPDLVSLGDVPPADKQELFGKFHTNSLLDFVNPNGFGFVKSRTAVAGFRVHRFGRYPELIDRWSVTRVELIGLLKHDPPKVYVSDLLPRMDFLKEAPTRELDAFEVEGLKAIRGGEDLFTRGADRDARMVGAIRSVNQCIECHGGKRGDLLGAFSYRIWKLGDVK